MREILFAFILGASCIAARAQSGSADLETSSFETTSVEKRVGEFLPLKIDQSSPVGIYLSTEWIATTGRHSLWSSINTYKYRFNRAADRAEASDESKQRILDNVIREVVVYRDVVAAVMVEPSREPMRGMPILVQLCRLEDGVWVAAGQDVSRSLEAAREKFARVQAENLSKELPVIERLKKIPQDTAPFVDHLKERGRRPVDFVLDALSTHKIVIWGEVHRRRVSWDVLRGALKDPRFVETTGTVFMELPSHAQGRMDSFFASRKMNPKIVFDIFSDLQLDGWFDRGEFEFIAELWKLNRSLPARKRIKVVLVDYQKPFSSLKTVEEFDAYPAEDRNTHMADVIERTVQESTDRRGNLFIVGYGHAYRSSVPGMASTPRGMTPARTAGSQIAGRFSPGEVFAIFPHSARMNNAGDSGGLLRGGVFDRAFAERGNEPVGFPLAGSPFGAEPFDGDLSLMCDPRMGSFADNFDGYVFFGPLADEEGDDYLYEIIDEGLVAELKRRIAHLGLRSWYGGLRGDDLTPERMIDYLKKGSEGKKRWAGAFEN